MAERFNATVLKTVVAKVTLSSNLSPSAKKYDIHLPGEFFILLKYIETSCLSGKLILIYFF